MSKRDQTNHTVDMGKKNMDPGHGLGLVSVKPVIDKEIEGVYDLEVVDIGRTSLNLTESSKPLLNAIRS